MSTVKKTISMTPKEYKTWLKLQKKYKLKCFSHVFSKAQKVLIEKGLNK